MKYFYSDFCLKRYPETWKHSNTDDKVFLLSLDEADEYLNKGLIACKPTRYAVSKGADVSKGNCYWWLRTRGVRWEFAVIGQAEGWINTFGDQIDVKDICVRPAMWIRK